MLREMNVASWNHRCLVCRNKRKFIVYGVCFLSLLENERISHPSKRLQDSTQVRPRLKYRQKRHWSGPGPQQPSSEHMRSHTILCWAETRKKIKKINFLLKGAIDIPNTSTDGENPNQKPESLAPVLLFPVKLHQSMQFMESLFPPSGEWQKKSLHPLSTAERSIIDSG